jgi:hypothetical protein
VGLLVASILLAVVAYLARPYFVETPNNPPLYLGVSIVTLILGLGAVVWRRTKFATMRLQDIAGLAGVSGLLQTLEKTTIQIALFGAAITAIGFISTLITGTALYTYRASAIAVLLFIYCYPTKSSWNRALRRFTQQPNPENPANTV